MLPNAVLSTIPKPAAFLPPRTGIRFSTLAGMSDLHYGGIALNDPSQGISYQLWKAFILGADILLSAPNTLAFPFLSGVNAVWVGLAFDQNSRAFVTYADQSGAASYYWYDSTIPGYRTSSIPGEVHRVFASLDDARPLESSSSDVILSYQRGTNFYFRAQRDRFGVEYLLGAAPATMVQIGMNRVNRFQFAFQNVQGDRVLPPAEFSGSAGHG